MGFCGNFSRLTELHKMTIMTMMMVTWKMMMTTWKMMTTTIIMMTTWKMMMTTVIMMTTDHYTTIPHHRSFYCSCRQHLIRHCFALVSPIYPGGEEGRGWKSAHLSRYSFGGAVKVILALEWVEILMDKIKTEKSWSGSILAYHYAKSSRVGDMWRLLSRIFFGILPKGGGGSIPTPKNCCNFLLL